MFNGEEIISTTSGDQLSFNSHKGKKKNYEEETIVMNAKRTSASTARRQEQLKEEYKYAVVNDFNDDYHLSDEEKEKNNQMYKAFEKLRRCKRKYRKLSDYVRVFRLALDCLDIVARQNEVYPVDKFKMQVVKGKITVYGLFFPKYVGKDRKDINWDYISEFIADRSLDPEQLDRKSDLFDIDYSDEEEVERMRHWLFGKDYYKIFGGEEDTSIDENDPHTLSAEQVECAFDNSFYDEEEIALEKEFTQVKVTSGKKMKKLMKTFPELKTFVSEIKRRRSDEERLSSFVFDTDKSDFEYIEKIDRKLGLKYNQPPEFKGDVMNDDDYYRYIREFEEWEGEHTYTTYRGRTKTLDEVRELEIRELLESSGWNIRNLYKNKEKEKKIEKQIKKDRKIERKLKEKLMNIKNRKKKRMGKEVDEDIPKKKKKKKNKKSKKEKLEKKRNKFLNDHKENMIETMDDILLDTITEEDYRNFQEYKEDMEDFTFENIFG